VLIRSGGGGTVQADEQRLKQALTNLVENAIKYRADPARGRDSGGSGLGLAICQEIATAHGGSISVQSEEGSGSTSTLALSAGAGARDMVGAA